MLVRINCDPFLGNDLIAEKFREKLVAELELTPARQAMLLTAGYLLICSLLAGWSMARCGIEWALPPLVPGTIHKLFQ